MASSRACAAVLLMMNLLHCQHSLVAAQNLPTTCPKVTTSKCPGICASTKAAAKNESGYCTGTQCSRTLAHAPAATASTAAQVQAGQSPQPPSPRHDPAAAEEPWWRQQQQPQAPVGPDGGVPQRVVPSQYAYADEPQETPEQQAAITKHLQSLFGSSSTCEASTGACSANNSSSSSSAQEQQQQQQRSGRRLAAPTPPTAAVTASRTRYSGPDSQVTRKLTFIENSRIKLGLDMDRAGVISWLSSPQAPGEWTGKNLINVWDQGRLLQQSFYGCVDGSCWATKPWLWNPVQGGSWENEPGTTTKKDVKPARLYVEGHPRNWGNQELIKSVLLTSDITLKENYGILKFSVKYTGQVTHPYMTQEVPAVFVDRRFSVLAYYQGSSPWTSDNAITYAFPAGRNMYARPTENWAAYIDPDTGYGVGVFNPLAWHGITAYRIGQDDSDLPWDCSYFAHTIRMQLYANMKQYNYTVYVATGKLDEIRATFSKLRNSPGVMPRRSASPADTTCVDCTNGISAGQPTLGRNPAFGVPANYSVFDNVVAEGPSSDAASSAGAGIGTAAAALAVGAGTGDVGAPTGLAVQGSPGSTAPQGSSSDVKAAVTGSTASGAAGAGDASLLGANGKRPAADGSGAASRAAGAGGKHRRSADGKTVAGGVVAAVVGCALLAGTVLAVVRSKRNAGNNGSSNKQQQYGQEAATAGGAQRGGAAHDFAGADKPAAHSPEAAASTVADDDAGAGSPLTPGVLTRSRAALAGIQQQATGLSNA